MEQVIIAVGRRKCAAGVSLNVYFSHAMAYSDEVRPGRVLSHPDGSLAPSLERKACETKASSTNGVIRRVCM